MNGDVYVIMKYVLFQGKLLDHTHADKEKRAPIANLFSIPQAAFGFLSKVASRLGLKSAGYNPVNTGIVEDLCDKEHLELVPSKRKFILESEIKASVDANISIRQLTTTQYNDSEESSVRGESPTTFCHFDMVGDCLDHHFIDGSGKESVVSQVRLVLGSSALIMLNTTQHSVLNFT